MASRDALPFLIVHGAMVWKALLVAFVAAVLALVAVLRRVAARRLVRAAVRSFDAGADDGTLRGRLGGPGGVTGAVLAASVEATGYPLEAFATSPTASIDWHADELWLDTADGRVAIAGAIRVVAGSRAAATRNRVPGATPAALLARSDLPPWLHRGDPLRRRGVGKATLATVAAGDMVIVRGRLERTASDAPSLYREGTPVLTLHPLDGTPVVLAALAPRVATLRLAWPVLAVAIAAAGFTGWGIERGYGSAPASECDAVTLHGIDEGTGRVLLTDGHPCARAAAMPETRDQALRDAYLVLVSQTDHDEASVRQLIAMTEFDSSCDDLVRKMLDYERFDDAASTAASCGEPALQRTALALEGKFREAAAVPRSMMELVTGRDAVLSIASGDWAAAADAAIDRAARIASQPVDAHHSPRAITLTALHYTCIAEVYRSYAGDAGAAARLQALAAGPDGATCTPALAELASGAARGALLAGSGAEPPLSETAMLLRRLAFLHGITLVMPLKTVVVASPEKMIVDPDSIVNPMESPSPEIWLAALAPPTARGIELLRWRTVASIFDGDLVAAAATAKEAAAVGAASDVLGQSDALDQEQEVLKLRLVAFRRREPSHHARGAEDAELAELAARQRDLMRRQAALEELLRARHAAAADEDEDERWDDAVTYGPLLPALVALHTPSTAVAVPPRSDSSRFALWRDLFPQLWVRRGDLLASDDVSRPGAEVRAAELGDGYPLARLLGRTRVSVESQLQAPFVLAVLPRIKLGRGDVARELEWAPHGYPTPSDDSFLFALAQHAVARRDTLRLAGAAPAAARWDAIYRRTAAVLHDRRTLGALLLWAL